MTTEQRIDIKFCVKLGKIATETLKMMHEVYSDSCTSRARVLEWHKRFVENDPKTGRPFTFKINANIEKVR